VKNHQYFGPKMRQLFEMKKSVVVVYAGSKLPLQYLRTNLLSKIKGTTVNISHVWHENLARRWQHCPVQYLLVGESDVSMS
jgi:hypothetical protein